MFKKWTCTIKNCDLIHAQCQAQIARNGATTNGRNGTTLSRKVEARETPESKTDGRRKRKPGREKDGVVNIQSTKAPRKVMEKAKEAKAKERARSTKYLENGASLHSTHSKDKLHGRSGEVNRSVKEKGVPLHQEEPE